MSSQDFFDRDPADLERYLIEQGRLDRPAEGVRKRAIVLSGLAASTASAGLATASIASGSSAASAVPWALAAKWIAIGVVSGMVTIGAAEGLRYEQRSEPTTPTAAVLPVVPPTARQPAKPMALAAPEEPSVASLVKSPAEHLVAPGSQAMLVHAAPSETGATGGATVDEVNRQAKDEPRPLAAGKPSTDAVRDEAPPARPARQGSGVSNVDTAPPAPGPSSPAPSDRDRDKSLKIELGFLDEARVALESHTGVNALRLLDDYAQQFPAGSMRIEAIALRIEALLVLGRRSDAQALGNDFLARYPANPAAMRVRLLLGPRDNRPAKP